MTTIQALLIFYYLFSLFFMVGFILGDEDTYYHPWKAVIAVLCAFITAPILFPMNLGATIKRMK